MTAHLRTTLDRRRLAVCTVYDLWAIVQHLLGLDHEKLTYRFGGRDLRLTDVHGQVVNAILA